MPKRKVLSGEEVIEIFKAFGFDLASQKGSHVKLKRILPDSVKQILTIPKHFELDKGTSSDLSSGSSLHPGRSIAPLFLFGLNQNENIQV